MFGKKCALCGSKLDGRGICTECGLDNNKSEKNYRINQSAVRQSALAGKSGTAKRSDMEKQVTAQSKKYTQPKTTYYKANQQKKEKNGAAKWVIITVVIVMVLIGITMVSVFEVMENNGVIHSSNIWQDDFGDSWWNDSGDAYEEIASDPYEDLTEELPANGTSVEYPLSSGKYVAGVHIPAGNYVAKVQDDFDVVQVWDYTNGIYLYEYEGKDVDNYLDDLRIYPGAVVTVSSETTVMFASENAQTDDMEGTPNPLTVSYQIEGGEVRTAGEDFEAGVYDLVVAGAYGQVEICVMDEEGYELEEICLFMGTEGSDGTTYKNMVFPEGAQISCDEEIDVELTPSEKIESTDYMSFYRRY